MVLDVKLGTDSLTMDIADPFHPDADMLVSRINNLSRTGGSDISGLDVKELILAMIRGIAGCEKGCPRDAKGIVSRGFKGFELQYIEGGILSARTMLGNGQELTFGMFPDF